MHYCKPQEGSESPKQTAEMWMLHHELLIIYYYQFREL